MTTRTHNKDSYTVSMKIEPLEDVSHETLKSLIVGYQANTFFDVTRSEKDSEMTFKLQLRDRPTLFNKQWNITHEKAENYSKICKRDKLSIGVLDKRNNLVGIAIVEYRDWAKDAYLWELHVDADAQGKGIGRNILASVERNAKDRELRAITLETQTSNPAAVGFYRSAGFNIDGMDIAHYSSNDLKQAEVALFMRKSL